MAEVADALDLLYEWRAEAEKSIRSLEEDRENAARRVAKKRKEIKDLEDEIEEEDVPALEFDIARKRLKLEAYKLMTEKLEKNV